MGRSGKLGGIARECVRHVIAARRLAYNCPVGANEVKKKLQDEITLLEYELRNELPREILKARLHGDLSENAEYHAAKDRQGFVNARLNQLKHRLAEMSMVDFTKIPHGKVGLGSTVVVLDTKKDEEITYFLVTTEEADAGVREDFDQFPDRPRVAGQGSGGRGARATAGRV